MKRINMYTAFIFGAQLITACLFSMLGTKWLESNATANYLSIDQDAPDFGLKFQSVDTWVLRVSARCIVRLVPKQPP